MTTPFKTTMKQTMKRQQRKLTTTQYRVSKPATKCRRANDSMHSLTYHTAPFISEIEGGGQHVEMNKRQIAWVEAPRRSVNSYILFRTFYMILTVLGNIPQKYKSAILSVLWERDPFHAKWSIIARAYTLMRNAGIKRTVSEYLVFVCPYNRRIISEYLAFVYPYLNILVTND